MGFNCSWMKDAVGPVLAIVVTVGGFLVIYYKPENKTEIIGLMTLVLSFYFGSSKGSQAKDEAITRLTEGGNSKPPPEPMG